MKRIPLALFFLMTCCNDSDTGQTLDYNSLCETSCTKQETCYLSNYTTTNECMTACENEAMNMRDEFFEAFVECQEEKSCSELQDGGQNSTICYDENITTCTSQTDSYVEAACQKSFECDGVDSPTAQQMQNCTSDMRGDGNVVICFAQTKIDETIRCIETATSCTPDPVKECVYDILGLELGAAGSGGGANKP